MLLRAPTKLVLVYFVLPFSYFFTFYVFFPPIGCIENLNIMSAYTSCSIRHIEFSTDIGPLKIIEISKFNSPDLRKGNLITNIINEEGGAGSRTGAQGQRPTEVNIYNEPGTRYANSPRPYSVISVSSETTNYSETSRDIWFIRYMDANIIADNEELENFLFSRSYRPLEEVENNPGYWNQEPISPPEVEVYPRANNPGNENLLGNPANYMELNVVEHLEPIPVQIPENIFIIPIHPPHVQIEISYPRISIITELRDSYITGEITFNSLKVENWIAVPPCYYGHVIQEMPDIYLDGNGIYWGFLPQLKFMPERITFRNIVHWIALTGETAPMWVQSLPLDLNSDPSSWLLQL